MAAPSVFAIETEGVVPIDVEVTLSAGSEIDLVIPLFTKSGSSTFDHSRGLYCWLFERGKSGTFHYFGSM